MVLAMSCGDIKLPSDMPTVMRERTTASASPVFSASAAITRSMRSPVTEPGQMQFTRIRDAPSSCARVRVRPRIAHLAAA